MSLDPLPDRDGVRVLRAKGELDVSVVPAMLPELASHVAGARAVVLDLSEVTFFDSSGVRLVDGLSRVCGISGVTLRVAAPPDSPSRRVLELVGLATGLVEDSLAAAIAAAQS